MTDDEYFTNKKGSREMVNNPNLKVFPRLGQDSAEFDEFVLGFLELLHVAEHLPHGLFQSFQLLLKVKAVMMMMMTAMALNEIINYKCM